MTIAPIRGNSGQGTAPQGALIPSNPDTPQAGGGMGEGASPHTPARDCAGASPLITPMLTTGRDTCK